MATETPQKPIHSLILDTGPLIKNAVSISTILNSAEEILTTPAIISEIRDEATRSRVQTTLVPFLKIRNPSPASYDAVVAFSKKTCDHAVLSRQDLGILALAYEVHCERNGGPWGLREAPKQPLKMRPGEEHKAEEAEDVEEEGNVEAEVNTGEEVVTEDIVKANEQPQDVSQEAFEVQKKGKKNAEQRIRKDRGSAKHIQKREERERRKQARALGTEASEQAEVEQQNATITADEVKEPSSDPTSQEQAVEAQSTLPVVADESTTTKDELTVEHAPTTQPEPELENKALSSESQQPADSIVTQEQSIEQAQDSKQQNEEGAGGVDVAQQSSQAIAEVSDAAAPQDAEFMSELPTLDLSTLNIATPPSPPATDDDDSDGDWITPSNLTKRQATDSGMPQDAPTVPQEQIDVATMTIDFAMQNVLLQMNLRLLSTNMQRIKTLTSKVLRCHACFHIVKQMDKQFCPRCGGASLRRVNCSTNSRGEFRLHLAKNYQWNKRGDKYSIPKPIAGTANTKWSGQGGGQGGWGRDLILAEDQKEFTRQMEADKRAKSARDLMDDDYLPGILTGHRDAGRAGGRPKVGAGKNVNSKKRG